MIEALFFYLLAALLVVLGLVVVTQAHPFASALALLGALGALAALYALLSAPLVAVLQLLVYAGGILVLLVFVLMTVRLDEGALKVFRVRPVTTAAALGAAALGLLVPLLLRLPRYEPSPTPVVSEGFGSLEAVAGLLFGPYLFPFEMLSLVLLAALVGAIVLAKRSL
jgi:NADH-quinone oxidoreductase subunit J